MHILTVKQKSIQKLAAFLTRNNQVKRYKAFSQSINFFMGSFTLNNLIINYEVITNKQEVIAVKVINQSNKSARAINKPYAGNIKFYSWK